MKTLMIIKKESLVFKILAILPCWIPIALMDCRVGQNTEDYIEVKFCNNLVWK